MILILSIKYDSTTTDVMQWLHYFGKKVLRLNVENNRVKLVYFSMDTDDIIIDVDGETYNLKNVDAIWYRKSGMAIFVENLSKQIIKSAFGEDQELELSVSKNLTNETRTISEYLHFFLETKKKLGSRFNANLNKLIVLYKAKELGLNIPSTFITNNKEGLSTILDKSKEGIITKALSNGIYTFSEKKAYYSYTEEIQKDDIQGFIPNNFFPSLIQTKIDKKYELRIFYLKGEFYSMAIFSQNDKQTEVDFRKYNHEKPNRNVPFIIDDHIANKLTKLLDFFKLDTGSIDMIVDKNNNYIFLEINPVGQFGMTSRPCNYNLEKKVAECLK
ncbi:ATP-GRASP peptide maturase of grasp-with-spasm system [Aquimarina sp. EL_43]|uniref:grasp-with-spasm system ATP-grasp peptide maturase n=1 Tax=unclassified Aquimarina TaxID=2627091 RepID=UPI0018C970AC|nr:MULTISPECIES: grasp-with-spasm system ATP-grasp peptide maturase [unclassified Aquimarina]MBG6133316.1 ATP-GRASP peptide maturase of grasp-with-spasm system [Aquimarina sp. EL_35]MBG6153505.1 ATP-GRASP peptide maturase of grasp-with-spasm system [Aquimarina sp. EL_32]MBG6171661.1 ATP-GRASP peptide maturase of grasp-with-spasm system [Aquimarina sp. EL_43]